MGSVVGTLQALASELREQGQSIGILSLRSFRPFPIKSIRNALKSAKQIIVFEKSFAVGMGGVLASEVHMATHGLHIKINSIIGGLGGRTITVKSLKNIVDLASKGELEHETFMDLDLETVEKEINRQRSEPSSGSTAENILRDMGVVSASKTH
jgi:pyruvate ferredoxin oxidoreductase alpha subunit